MFDKKAYMKTYNKAHYQHQTKWRNKEQLRKYGVEYRKNHPPDLERWVIDAREYRRKHPERKYAQNLARYIPLKPSCEFGNCTSTEKLEHAHLDYDYPLEVVTFCAKHHRLVDRLYGRFD